MQYTLLYFFSLVVWSFWFGPISGISISLLPTLTFIIAALKLTLICSAASDFGQLINPIVVITTNNIIRLFLIAGFLKNAIIFILNIQQSFLSLLQIFSILPLFLCFFNIFSIKNYLLCKFSLQFSTIIYYLCNIQIKM